MVQGHLQVDHCTIQDGQIWVQAPGSIHMRYCTLEHTQVAFHCAMISIIENCYMESSKSCAISIEGSPKLGTKILCQDLLKVGGILGFDLMNYSTVKGISKH